MASAKHYNTYTSIFACVFIMIIYAYNNIIIKSAINARGVHNNIIWLVCIIYIVPPFTEIQWHAQRGRWVSADTRILNDGWCILWLW